MKAIICGCGSVGSAIATYLFKEKHQVAVIDPDATKLKNLSDNLDIQTIQGYANNPETLSKAGAKDTDLIISLTNSDEVNMMICFEAFRCFNVPMKIARIRSGFYSNTKYPSVWDEMHIDVAITPEKEVANTILRNLKTAGALEFILLQGKNVFFGAKCVKGATLEKMKIEKIDRSFPEFHICIAGLLRDGENIEIEPKTTLKADDEIYAVTDIEHYGQVLSALGHPEPKSKRTLIVGGGRVASNLIPQMQNEGMAKNVFLIEKNEEKAKNIAALNPDIFVINGDALDEGILDEAGINDTDEFVCLTDEDENNILLSLVAKQHNVNRTFALINRPIYNNMLSNLGVDVIVNPNAVSTSTILQHIRKGQVKSIYSLKAQIGDLMEFEALETSKVIGKKLGKIRLPKGVRICAVVRSGQLLEMSPDVKIQSGDTVIVLAQPGQFASVEKLFAAGLYFF